MSVFLFLIEYNLTKTTIGLLFDIGEHGYIKLISNTVVYL